MTRPAEGKACPTAARQPARSDPRLNERKERIIMSTSHQDMENGGTRLSFEIIDARIKALDMESSANKVLFSADAMQRFLTIYAAVRPILTIVSMLPLLAPHWRDALRLFLGERDTVATFKAADGLW